MKKLLLLAFSLVIVCLVNAQQKPTDLDKSPMDISYWPANYPILKLNGKVKDAPIARIIYSRPQKNNRLIFDGIIKYNEMWRLGANEATEIEFFKNVKIGNKLITKGRYTLYCIPNTDKWTIIVSNDNYSWGNYSYDIKKDVTRTDAKVEKNPDTVENFTVYFNETKTGANLIMLWDDVKATLPITLATTK
ncbi:MAG: DUF2911 domain-containing protein [Bacteroidetes bacterium]|nr:DUF2911 domain-containing protein [Bacteroidota bacterium]